VVLQIYKLLKLLRPTPILQNFFDGRYCPTNRLNTMPQSRD